MFVQIALTFSHLVHCSPAADVLWNLEFKYFKRGQERQTNFRDVLHSLTTPPTSENDSGLNDSECLSPTAECSTLSPPTGVQYLQCFQCPNKSMIALGSLHSILALSPQLFLLISSVQSVYKLCQTQLTNCHQLDHLFAA